MKTILIANPKGGCGKTTLSVNIAGYLANRGNRVAMLDMDRQQSAALWIETRPDDLPPIRAMKYNKESDSPSDWLVVDSSAGLSGSNLAYSLIRQANKIIVPVTPSLFDLHASRDFLKELLEEKKVRNSPCHIGVVGMRIAQRTRAATVLEDFLDTLGLPILAYLRETQVYVNAAFEGKSLFDLPHHIAERELEQWEFLQDWIEQD
ncbi:MAG: cobyrinic acid a,c-diamide synthase [Gallionellales bacterium RIFCSPLOWO2_02_FULL_57_47]|nr:MAG: cobyrinic acid a,c-diamide synthase [Gallionellales bacterium RIFCSPLOWO2_02_FULL_57_47]